MPDRSTFVNNTHVGIFAELVDVLTPTSWSFNAPMRAETWVCGPPADDDNWDHVVKVDLDVPNGTLMFQASGGGSAISCEVPTGSYRARMTGRRYDPGKGRHGCLPHPTLATRV